MRICQSCVKKLIKPIPKRLFKTSLFSRRCNFCGHSIYTYVVDLSVLENTGNVCTYCARLGNTKLAINTVWSHADHKRNGYCNSCKNFKRNTFDDFDKTCKTCMTEYWKSWEADRLAFKDGRL